MTIIGTIGVSVVAKTAQFVSGIDKSVKSLAGFQKQAATAGQAWSTASKMIGAGVAVFTAGKIVSGIRATAEELDSLGKVADKLGIKAESMAALRFGGAQAGVDAAILDASLQKLINNISEVAKTGKGAAAPALKELSLRATELVKSSPDKMLEATADAFQGVTNQADKVRLSIDLFGKSGTAMLAMLEGGSAGLRAMQDEARALGIAIDRDSIAKVEEMNDAMGRLSAAMGGFKTQFVIDIAPAAAKAVDALTEAVKGAKILRDARSGGGVGGFFSRLASGQTSAQKWVTSKMISGQISGGIAMGDNDQQAYDNLKASLGGGTRAMARLAAQSPGFNGDRVQELADRTASEFSRSQSVAHLTDTIAAALTEKARAATESGTKLLGVLGEKQKEAATWYDSRFTLGNILGGGGAQASRDKLAAEQFRNGLKEKPSGMAASPGNNEALRKGTAAAFAAERSGDRVNQYLREQILIAKQQAKALEQIATNTKAGGSSSDIWDIGA